MNTAMAGAAVPGEARGPTGLVLAALERAGAFDKPGDWSERLGAFSADEVGSELGRRPRFDRRRLLAFLSPAAATLLEEMAVAAHRLTRRRFGNAISLFAPLYVSNYCVNRCRYCGFNSGQRHRRRRLSLDEAFAEAETIAGAGFRDILLVSGEDRGHVSLDYLCALGEKLRRGNFFSSVGVEIAAQSLDGYRRLFAAGIDGVTIFQETYDRRSYAFWHGPGPKSVFENRIAAQEDAARAGMRRLGLGALLGLEDWRFEAFALGVHADVLARNYWRARVSFSFPRIRPTESGAERRFRHLVSDAELTQMVLALRLCFPDAGMTLSTRESPGMRNHLIPLGFTQISAGSKVNPGGYSGKNGPEGATGQFEVSDGRGPAEMAVALTGMGFDPVWKDWDAGFQSGVAPGGQASRHLSA